MGAFDHFDKSMTDMESSMWRRSPTDRLPDEPAEDEQAPIAQLRKLGELPTYTVVEPSERPDDN
jgi:hypothetical protein